MMTDLREPYASTALASLEWSEERERAIDRVAAAGRASKLGVDLWKARYMLESRAYKAASKGLVGLFLGHYTAESLLVSEKCVEEALSEWMGPACSTCNGARELFIGELRVQCGTCRGSGMRLYTDSERAGKMRISQQRVRLLAGKLRWLAGELGTLDRAVSTVMAAELERPRRA